MYVNADYRAEITTPAGRAIDQGQAPGTQFTLCPSQDIRIECGPVGSGHAFSEDFVSSQLTLFPPPAPTSAAQCKAGGFRNFPTLGFKNQGDCVSFVATHGKTSQERSTPDP